MSEGRHVVAGRRRRRILHHLVFPAPQGPCTAVEEQEETQVLGSSLLFFHAHPGESSLVRTRHVDVAERNAFPQRVDRHDG